LADQDLTEARPARGIEKLWARNKIASLEESRVRGFGTAYVDSQVLDVALAHHLTSRLTSLVAVDVAPGRPVKETLTSAQVPVNLPDGWDADAFLGETPAHDEQHAAAPAPMPAGIQLALLKGPEAAVAPEDSGVVLPQTATSSRRLFALGVLFLVIAAGLMLRKRTASEGTR